MCRCCQSFWEYLYWNCIEERFCYDESIANYDPDTDEYLTTQSKMGNGFLSSNGLSATMENNNAPICRQPSRIQRNFSTVSSKIHEQDLHREIQTNIPMLAPEVLAVFANSQIFQGDKKSPSAKSPSSVKFVIESPSPPSSTKQNAHRTREEESEELLRRLEASLPSMKRPESKSTIPAIIEEEDSSENIIHSTPKKDKQSQAHGSFDEKEISNKSMTHLQAAPYFSFRPASENDIFTISSPSYRSISDTPEVPAISFSNLPKNYLETPSIEYREALSLTSIKHQQQTSVDDYTMPRYYRKGDLILSAENVENDLLKSPIASTSNITPKRLEKSQRLQKIRKALPPLTIKRIGSTASLREKDKDKSSSKGSKDKIRI